MQGEGGGPAGDSTFLAHGPTTTRVLTLGSCEVVVGSPDTGTVVRPGSLGRRLLARLALAYPEGVDLDTLVEAMWHDAPPRTARAAVHNQISRLRATTAAEVVLTVPGGYRIGVEPDHLDVLSSIARAESALGTGDADAAHAHAEAVIVAFRGRPFEELDHVDAAAIARRRLEAVRRAAELIRVEAALLLDRCAWSVVEAERLVSEDDLDEARWCVLVSALHRSGRRGDALGAIERARRRFRDQLGLDPGPALEALEASILDPAARPRRSLDVPCLGRHEVVDEISGSATRRQTVVVRGEPGAGKTTVLAEVARRLRADGFTVARTSCPAHPDSPAASLRDLLDELGIDVQPTIGVINGFVSAVEHRSTTTPVALLVDDIHLAGPSTMATLRACARLDGVALVVATDEPVDPSGVDATAIQVSLRPLDRATISTMAAQRLGTPSDDDRTSWLLEMSGGNPLFVELLLDDLDTLDGPDGLTDLVRGRLARLSSSVRKGLDVAAVAGRQCDIGLVRAVTAGAVDLREAERHGLVDITDGCVRFRHGAVQLVVYDDLSPGRRSELHHTLGTVLRDGGDADLVAAANHLLAAAELDPVGAATAAVAAASSATRLGAHDDAALWYERALSVLDPTDDTVAPIRIDMMVGFGDALRLAGDPRQEEMLLAAADAAFELGDVGLLGDAAAALLQLGVTTPSGDPHHRAIEIADRALAAGADPERRAVVSAAASLAYSLTGSAERCRGLFEEAERGASACRTRRRVLPFAYLALGHPDDLDRRDQLTDELLRRGVEHDDAVARFEALHLRFSAALQRGHGLTARRSLHEMIGLVDQVGDVGRRWALLYQQAAIAHLDDELDLAERLSTEALDLFAAVAPSRAFAAHGAQLLAIRIVQDRAEELAPQLRSLLDEQAAVPAWHAAYAVAVARCDPTTAAQHAERAIDTTHRDFTWLVTHVLAGRAAALTGSGELARRCIDQLEPYRDLAAWQGSCSFGPVATVLAMLYTTIGDHEAAADAARRAAEMARSLAAPAFTRELASVTRSVTPPRIP